MSTYYLDDFEIGHSIFLNEDLTSYGVIDTNVTGHTVGNKFVFETQYWDGVGCARACATTGIKLQYNEDDAGWVDVGAATPISYADCSGLTDEGASTDNCTAQATCASGFEAGIQCEDAVTAHTQTTEYYSNTQWGLGTVNATPGSTYALQVYDTTNNGAISFEITPILSLIHI